VRQSASNGHDTDELPQPAHVNVGLHEFLTAAQQAAVTDAVIIRRTAQSSRSVKTGWPLSAYGRELSTLHGYREKLSEVVTQLGGIELQKLTKRHIDDLVAALRAGGLKSPTGKTRKPWTPRSANYLLGLLTAVIESEAKQGHVVRNVAELVDRIPRPSIPPAPSRPPTASRWVRRTTPTDMSSSTMPAGS
jgi:hypothetical protein